MGDTQTAKVAETTRVHQKTEDRPPHERESAPRPFAEATLFRSAASDDPATPPQHLARVLRRLATPHRTGFLLQCQRHYGNVYVQRMVSSLDHGHQSKSAGSLAGSFDAGEEVEARLDQSKGGGRPLPESVREYMEPRFGVDFSHVRVHTGSNAVQMNRDLSAHAFTHGADIYFGAGHSPTNSKLTAHELTHVVQQTGGVPLQTQERDEERARASATAAPPMQQRTEPAIHRLGLSDVVSLGRDAAIDLIGRYSPGLAEFIRNGPMAMLVETIKRGVQNWLSGLLGGVNVGGAISGLVSSLTSAFAAIRESDNPACATLAASIDGLRKLGQAVMDSPAIKIAQAVFSTVGAVFQQISDVIIGGAFDTVMGIVGGVTDMAKTIWGWIVTAKDALGVAWDTVKKTIGLDDDENGIIATLKAKAAEGWEVIKSGIAPLVGPLKTLLKLMLVFSPVGPVILIIKYLPPLVETVQWLWAHKGDTDIIKSSEEAGHTVLPTLLRTVQGFGQGVQEVASALVKGATELREAVLTVMGVITGLPLLSIAQGLTQALANGVQELVTMAETGIKAAAQAIGELFQKAKNALQPFIDVLVPLGMCIVNPTMIPIILGGKAWLALDDCYKEPIIDFLLDIAIGLLKKAPDVSMFGPLWKVLRQGVIGFLEGVRGRPKDEKIRITNKLARILSGGNPGFMVGFAKGLLIGLWKGLISPFELVYDLIKLLNHVQAWAEKAGEKTLDQALAPAAAAPGAATAGAAAGPVPVPSPATGGARAPATSGAPTATIAAPPTSSGNGTGDPGQAALQQKLGQLVSEVGPPVKEVTVNFMPAMQETFTSGGGMTYADVKDKLGSLMAGAEAALHQKGKELADIACRSFLNDANDAQLGEDIGNISGQIIFEIILLVLTEGLIEALKPLQGIAKMLDFVGEAIGAGIKWLGKIGGWVVDGVKGLWKFVENSGAGKKVVQALQNIGEILMRYADELLGLVGKKAGGEAAEAVAEQTLKEFGPRAAKLLEKYGDDFTQFVTHYGPDASKLSDGSIESFLKWKKGLSSETQLLFEQNPALWRTYTNMDPRARNLLTLCASECIPKGATPEQAKRILELIEKHGLADNDPALKQYLHAQGDNLDKALDDLASAKNEAELRARMQGGKAVEDLRPLATTKTEAFNSIKKTRDLLDANPKLKGEFDAQLRAIEKNWQDSAKLSDDAADAEMEKLLKEEFASLEKQAKELEQQLQAKGADPLTPPPREQPAFVRENRAPQDAETVLGDPARFTDTGTVSGGRHVFTDGSGRAYYVDRFHRGTAAEIEVFASTRDGAAHLGTIRPDGTALDGPIRGRTLSYDR